MTSILTSKTRCATCGHHATPGYLTCDDCTDRTRTALQAIPDLYHRIARLYPVPGTTNTSGRGGGHRFESKSPANDHLIAITDPRTGRGRSRGLHHPPAILYRWAAHVRDCIGLDKAAADPRADAQLLVDRLDWITRQTWVHDCATQIDAVHRQLLDANGYRHVPVGKCPNVIDDQGTKCLATLHAPLQGDTIRCTRCHQPYPRVEWVKLGRQQGVM